MHENFPDFSNRNDSKGVNALLQSHFVMPMNIPEMKGTWLNLDKNRWDFEKREEMPRKSHLHMVLIMPTVNPHITL